MTDEELAEVAHRDVEAQRALASFGGTDGRMSSVTGTAVIRSQQDVGALVAEVKRLRSEARVTA